MTEILVDTSILILFYQDRLDPHTEGMLRTGRSKISIMTYYELMRWFLKIGRATERDDHAQKLKNTFGILPLNTAICENAAQFSHSNSLSAADALIYATAQHKGMKMLTSDSDLKGKPSVIYVKPKNG